MSKIEICLRDEKHVFFKRSWISKADEITKILQNFYLERCRLQPESKISFCGKIFIIRGPGAFTSIRIGVTIANALAFVYKIPIISCTVFEYFQKRIPLSLRGHTLLLLPAGGEFLAAYAPDAKKEQIIPAALLPDFLKAYPGIRWLAGNVKRKDIAPQGLKWLPEKKMLSFSEVIAEVMKTKSIEFHQVEPYYLQPPHITVSKKETFV